MPKFADNTLVLPHAAGVFHNLKMVMPFSIYCVLFGYSLNMGISLVLIHVYIFPRFCTTVLDLVLRRLSQIMYTM